MSRPFIGHNVSYQCKGLDQSNIECEYEENRLTSKKEENETLMQMTLSDWFHQSISQLFLNPAKTEYVHGSH